MIKFNGSNISIAKANGNNIKKIKFNGNILFSKKEVDNYIEYDYNSFLTFLGITPVISNQKYQTFLTISDNLFCFIETDSESYYSKIRIHLFKIDGNVITRVKYIRDSVKYDYYESKSKVYYYLDAIDTFSSFISKYSKNTGHFYIMDLYGKNALDLFYYDNQNNTFSYLSDIINITKTYKLNFGNLYIYSADMNDNGLLLLTCYIYNTRIEYDLLILLDGDSNYVVSSLHEETGISSYINGNYIYHDSKIMQYDNPNKIGVFYCSYQHSFMNGDVTIDYVNKTITLGGNTRVLSGEQKMRCIEASDKYYILPNYCFNASQIPVFNKNGTYYYTNNTMQSLFPGYDMNYVDSYSVINNYIYLSCKGNSDNYKFYKAPLQGGQVETLYEKSANFVYINDKLFITYLNYEGTTLYKYNEDTLTFEKELFEQTTLFTSYSEKEKTNLFVQSIPSNDLFNVEFKPEKYGSYYQIKNIYIVNKVNQSNKILHTYINSNNNYISCTPNLYNAICGDILFLQPRKYNNDTIIYSNIVIAPEGRDYVYVP